MADEDEDQEFIEIVSVILVAAEAIGVLWVLDDGRAMSADEIDFHEIARQIIEEIAGS